MLFTFGTQKNWLLPDSSFQLLKINTLRFFKNYYNFFSQNHFSRPNIIIISSCQDYSRKKKTIQWFFERLLQKCGLEFDHFKTECGYFPSRLSCSPLQVYSSEEDSITKSRYYGNGASDSRREHRGTLAQLGLCEVFPPRCWVAEHLILSTPQRSIFSATMAMDGAYRLELEPQKKNVFVTQLRLAPCFTFQLWVLCII